MCVTAESSLVLKVDRRDRIGCGRSNDLFFSPSLLQGSSQTSGENKSD